MSSSSQKTKQNARYRVILVTVCILMNFVLAFITTAFNLPVYLDTAGTIIASYVGGILPGMLTAVASNFLCSVFDSHSLYYSMISTCIALFTVWFTSKRFTFRKSAHTLAYIVTIGAFSGIVSSVIQWEISSGPEKSVVVDMLETTAGATDYPRLPVFIFINICLNLVDKAAVCAMAMIVMFFIPERIRSSIRDSFWKQSPLSYEGIESIRNWRKDLKTTSKRRITTTFLGAFLILTFFLSAVALFIFFENEKEETISNAFVTAEYAENLIDATKVSAYMKSDGNDSEYKQLKRSLSILKNNTPGLDELSVIRVSEDGFSYIFAINDKNVTINEVLPMSHEMQYFFSDGSNPESVQYVFSSKVRNWHAHIIYPIMDGNRNVVCYLYMITSVGNLKAYVRSFVVKVFLVLAPVIALIFIYALKVMDIYSVYPISTMAESLDRFAEAGNSQEAMDENVKRLRGLEIHTGDEVEKLYRSLCRMTSNQSEQMRNNTRLSDSTARMQDGLIITMADLVENRDSDTGAHIQKTAAYVKIIVDGLEKLGYYSEKITPKFKSDIVRSAPLHDIGKINIPDYVLNKPGKLTDEEYEIIKTHTVYGKKIMEKAIDTVGGENYLKEARNMAAYHHERWDGKGYPEKLHGEVIPLSARIMAVADVFDALTSPRVYKPAFPIEKALEMIMEGSGTQFDPKCVEAFMESLPEIKIIVKKYNQNV
ncbi:MAG: HD-GYP domain-containing protein [Lachnospiraceae bacterium]|nr:HD-GYP domain-containing protein [Lachnospiraceae bacterium]